MTPLRVLGDRILVQPDEDLNTPERLASGIHIAKTLAAAVAGQDKTTSVQRGTVVAVGTPRHPMKAEVEALADELSLILDDDRYLFLLDLVRREPAVAIGDDVLFNHDAGQLIALENQSYIILHEHELIAVVEPEAVPA